MIKCRFDVLGIGNAIVDILAHVSEEFLNEHQLVKSSMTLIDQQRAESIYASLPPAIEISGGSAANTITGVVSFGGKGAFIGKVQQDDLGCIFEHDLKSAGVFYNTEKALSGLPTARSLIAITKDAERTMATFLGATRQMAIEDIDATLIESSKVIYLEGYLWDEAHAKSAMTQAMHVATKAGRKVAFTLSDAFCVDRHREEFLYLIKNHVDILFANMAEITALYLGRSWDEIIQLCQTQTELTAITRGSEGSLIITRDQVYEIEAKHGCNVMDTTGAGDLYASGLLYGYTHGYDMPTCGKLATLAASEIITHVGARPNQSLYQLAEQEGLIR